MAVVVNQAVEMYSILKVFREVAADPALDAKHKLWVCKDLRKSLPARVLCGQCGDTYDIIMSIMTNAVEDMTNAAAKPTPASDPVLFESTAPKAKAKPKRKKLRTKK